MSTDVTWYEIALRLFLALIAGAVIGFNRSERGRPAGLRTTLLVVISSALSMILANLLMQTRGKAADSFVQLDTMRIPLGILTGMGFIGAGTVLKRENMVTGITTAATLWCVTVLGLCFGAGYHLLGIVGTGLCMVAIAGLKWLDDRVTQDREALLAVTFTDDALTESQIRQTILDDGIELRSCGLLCDHAERKRELTCHVSWRSSPQQADTLPKFLERLDKLQGVTKVLWSPHDLVSS